MSSNAHYFCGSFLAVFDSENVARIFADVVRDVVDTGDKQPLNDCFDYEFVDNKSLQFSLTEYCVDVEESVEFLKDAVEKFKGKLGGYVVVEEDNGDFKHIGVSDDGGIVVIDVYDIIAQPTSKLLKAKKYMEEI
jgi:hypothetical protein